MLLSIENIKNIVGGIFLNYNVHNIPVSNISYDTRKLSFQRFSLFFALQGPKSDGHEYISDAYNKGIRNFVVSRRVKLSDYPQANFILCSDALFALQSLAAYHRNNLSHSILAITGSNGKTIVKEWLAEALAFKYKIGKSPLSYNSQLGVALSLLQLQQDEDLSIIEAGISQVSEMERLEKMIKPSLGLMTNIGTAHDIGFSSIKEKLKEKLSLFSASELVFYCVDHHLIHSQIQTSFKNKTFTWGASPDADLKIISSKKEKNHYFLQLEHASKRMEILLPFTMKDMVENAMHVISYLIHDQWTPSEIQQAIGRFSHLPNRMEIKNGINDCLLINDSYSSDLTSMRLALEQLEDQAGSSRKVLITTAMEQQNEDSLYDKLSNLIDEKSIDEVHAIGIPSHQLSCSAETSYYPDTDTCLKDSNLSELQAATILIKGARKFKLERLFNLLAERVHQTRLETNLSAIAHNINIYRSKLQRTTKIMAVVKAEAYGSGSIQMVKFLEGQKIDYLAVALIDEAVQLRKNGCTLPIMVFNVQKDNLDQLWEFDLEPEVYDLGLLQNLNETSKAYKSRLKIHLKLDTGMNRLGFLQDQIDELIQALKTSEKLEIVSIFSHLAASENKIHDLFTEQQFENYEQHFASLVDAINLDKNDSVKPLRHILNTAGIIRYPEKQYDMVRLGLGIYGIDESGHITHELQAAHTLKAKVLQIKQLKKGETTGYNRMGQVTEDTEIAIVSIGYADGLIRLAGNGNHRMTINGSNYSTIGNICMDVCMLDLGSNHKVSVGDDVEVFSPENPVQNLAKACKTITYEVISRLSPRIKRTYIYV